MDYRECGFCGRKMKTPLVRAGSLGFCCTSCFKAYEALHPQTAVACEGTKRPKKAATRKAKKKAKKHVNRKPKRSR